VELIAIGNGTASRETDRLGAKLTRLHPKLKLTKVVVSEPGARPGVRSRSGQETFAGASGSDEDAPSVQIQSDDSLAATEGPGRPRRGVGRR